MLQYKVQHIIKREIQPIKTVIKPITQKIIQSILQREIQPILQKEIQPIVQKEIQPILYREEKHIKKKQIVLKVVDRQKQKQVITKGI